MDQRIRRAFGLRVRELRNRAGLSQERLAFLSGIHRTYIGGGIERGERDPTLETMASLPTATSAARYSIAMGRLGIVRSAVAIQAPRVV